MMCFVLPRRLAGDAARLHSLALRHLHAIAAGLPPFEEPLRMPPPRLLRTAWKPLASPVSAAVGG
jgi:hypothetical protein